jgi:OOP family OmpA-OmpF porin
MQRTLDDIARQFNSPLLHDWQLLVVGHADDRGSASDNEVMSLARAVNVQRYLVGRGVDAARLRSEGRGEREPLATNDRRYGRELNRRVELFLHRGPLPATATAPR